jgi:carbonic anhydrase
MDHLNTLRAGYKEFRKVGFKKKQALYEKLATQGQDPKFMLIACCDSRVNPFAIYGADPGDLFIVRNVANLVPPYSTGKTHHGTSSAIEFGIKALGIKTIIIMGHSHCGGIKAIAEKTPDSPSAGEFIDPWIEIAKGACQSVDEKHPQITGEERYSEIERESVIFSLKNLMSFPFISERVLNDDLTLLGTHFDIQTGTLSAYDPERGDFHLFDEEPASTRTDRFPLYEP